MILSPDAALAQAQKLIADGRMCWMSAPPPAIPMQAMYRPTLRLRACRPFGPICKSWRAAKRGQFSACHPTLGDGAGRVLVERYNGFAEPSLYDELADYDGQLVLMHAIQAKGIATRQEPPEGDIWPHILRFFEARLGL